MRYWPIDFKNLSLVVVMALVLVLVLVLVTMVQRTVYLSRHDG